MGVITLIVLACVLALVQGEAQTNEPYPYDIKTDWNYVTVRENAHMFYWFYYQDPSFAPSFLEPLDPIPIVVWLQGGPGASSTGYGNFEELGPLDLDFNRRNTSWTGLAHVLFVDNPVGAGYSYVTDDNAYCKDIHCVATDLVTLFAGFFDDHPDLRQNPFYIFCESYGGKMAAAAAQEMDKQIKAGTLDANLKGVGLGDAWISPMDAVNTWGPYLFDTSLLDWHGLNEVNSAAKLTQSAVDEEKWDLATYYWGYTELIVVRETDSVDFYNILFPHHPEYSTRKNTCSLDRMDEHVKSLYRMHVEPYAVDPLTEIMTGVVADYLGIPENVTWGSQSGDVFDEMSGDFMQPVIDIVDDIITRGMIVNVYNGMLDLIVDTPGQELWVSKLEWSQLVSFLDKRWTPKYAYSGADTGGFKKKIDNFEFWWVLDAGHMVPADQGEFMLYILHSTATNQDQ